MLATFCTFTPDANQCTDPALRLAPLVVEPGFVWVKSTMKGRRVIRRPWLRTAGS